MFLTLQKSGNMQWFVPVIFSDRCRPRVTKHFLAILLNIHSRRYSARQKHSLKQEQHFCGGGGGAQSIGEILLSVLFEPF